MEPIRLSEILRATGGELVGPVSGDPVVPAVTTDSRAVVEGALFVPLRGKKTDGHRFLDQAFLAGAGFALVAADAELARVPARAIRVRDTTKALGDVARWHRSRFDVPVVGITGSCGKTTTKEMMRLVLGDRVVASPASYNNEIGVPLTLLQMDRRTEAAVVEIGTNAPGEIAYLASIARPTVGVVTNVEEAHLEGLGDVRGVMKEKSALLAALPRDGAAIVNADNYWCREMIEGVRSYLVTYGTWEDADVYGTKARVTDDGVGFDLFDRMPFEVPALGIHNVHNALAAVAVALWLGRDPVEVRRALLDFRAPEMRMRRDVVGDVVLINDAYNANPRSMEAAVVELGARPVAGRRVAVVGDMLELGEQTERCHRELGRKLANAKPDLVWAVGPHARWTAEEAVASGTLPAARVVHHASVEEALAAIPFEPRAGDTWLFKASRGMRLERLVEAVRARVEGEDGSDDPSRARKAPAAVAVPAEFPPHA
ncbi:MAG: UDP-N-acetylmuramoyl-tripeptide--D-alanyl-D-alanine ligase [Planctomycetes bacterium]|nr:UDP-N-acetylmuramoyl-tripeptide--D-alanyl-D-alanine ligase [Planctomycetota bacterium]